MSSSTHVEDRLAAIGARARAQLVLLGLEMARDRLAPRRLRLRLRLRLFRHLLGSRRTLLEGAPSFALDGRRCGGRTLLGRELSVLALRDREQLRHALVQPCELGDESTDLLAKLSVLSAQCLDLAHARVEIILGDLCRSS